MKTLKTEKKTFLATNFKDILVQSLFSMERLVEVTASNREP